MQSIVPAMDALNYNEGRTAGPRKNRNSLAC
jgi:hypothetical protein